VVDRHDEQSVARIRSCSIHVCTIRAAWFHPFVRSQDMVDSVGSRSPRNS
jgi:hypothetical protein